MEHDRERPPAVILLWSLPPICGAIAGPGILGTRDPVLAVWENPTAAKLQIYPRHATKPT
ncbi:MAG: hypothetical protein ACPG4T_02680 [Nannocystaceae bacterium]